VNIKIDRANNINSAFSVKNENKKITINDLAIIKKLISLPNNLQIIIKLKVFLILIDVMRHRIYAIKNK